MDTNVNAIQHGTAGVRVRNPKRRVQIVALLTAIGRRLWSCVRSLVALWGESPETLRLERQRHSRHTLTYHGLPGA